MRVIQVSRETGLPNEKVFNVTSHVLENNTQDLADTFAPFHCWKCGKLLIMVKGNALYSGPGLTQGFLPVLHLCRTCKQHHLFNSIV